MWGCVDWGRKSAEKSGLQKQQKSEAATCAKKGASGERKVGGEIEEREEGRPQSRSTKIKERRRRRERGEGASVLAVDNLRAWHRG